MPKKTFVFSIAALFMVNGLWAGGWNNTLMGCRAIGMGAAFVGIADDPSAIFYNPAGLAFQRQDLNFSINGFYIWPTHEYVMPTGKKAQSKYNSTVPQMFFSYRINERTTLGFGFYVPFAGGGIDWKEEELGSPFKSILGIYTLTPTFAYQVSEKLSVGFTINFYRGVLEVNTKVDPFTFVRTEENGSAVSAGFGLMFRPTDKIGVGMNVRGPAKMKLTGKTSMPVTIPGLGTGEVDFQSETSFDLPWDIEAGVSYKIGKNLLVSASAQYTMWSALDKVRKTIKNPFAGDVKVDEDMDFKDILVARAGIEYHFPQGISIRAGIGIDRYATPRETLDFRNIDVDKITLLGGIGYRTGKMQIDFSYVYAFGKEREKEFTYFGLPLTERYNLNVLIIGMGVTFSL